MQNQSNEQGQAHLDEGQQTWMNLIARNIEEHLNMLALQNNNNNNNAEALEFGTSKKDQTLEEQKKKKIIQSSKTWTRKRTKKLYQQIAAKKVKMKNLTHCKLNSKGGIIILF